MTYTIFQNPGELDPRLISLFGASVKETSNPIGKFGTGVKNAIAQLLAAGQTLTILSGNRRITFDTEIQNFRGTDVEIVCMSDGYSHQQLGFTTALGAHWEPWEFYRELLCNALDEGGDVEVSETMPKPVEGHTFFVVEGSLLAEVHRNRAEFFLDTVPLQLLHSTPDVDIYAGPTRSLWFRSIRVHQTSSSETFGFTYNLKTTVDLTEDRTLDNLYEVTGVLARAILSSENPGDFTNIFAEFYENRQFDFNWSIQRPTEAWMTFLSELAKHNLYKIPSSLRQACVAMGHPLYKVRKVLAADATQADMIARAKDLCQGAGFLVSADIEVCEEPGSAPATIYLTPEDFANKTLDQFAAQLLLKSYYVSNGYSATASFLAGKLIQLGRRLQPVHSPVEVEL